MRAPTIAAIAVANILFSLVPAAAGDGPLAAKISGMRATTTSDLRILTPSGYASRVNSHAFRCAPATSSGPFTNSPDIVRVCAPGDR